MRLDEVTIGDVLNAAARSAAQKISDGSFSAHEVDEAKVVLESVEKQRRHLESKISQEQTKRPARLADLISAAENKAKHQASQPHRKNELER